MTPGSRPAAEDAVDELIAAVHGHGSAWAADAGASDERGAIGAATAEGVRQVGAHRSLQPRVFGGLHDSIEAHMRIVAAVGEHCMSTAWCTAVWSVHNWMAALFSEQAQQEVWADPAELISASIVPKNRFKARGNDVVVQGRFSFASGCDHAGWFGVGGMAELAGAASPTPVVCLLPGDDVAIDHDSWNVTGLRGTGSKDIVVDEPVMVPAHRVLPLPLAIAGQAPGQLGADRRLYRAPFRATAAIVLAAPVVGAGRAALRRFRERLDGHVIVARAGSQRSDPAAALRFAESAVEIDAAELLLLRAARRLEELAETADADEVEVLSVGRDTSFGVRLCAQAVDRLYEASGGTALKADEPMQRLWRDVHAARSHAILTWDAAAAAYGAAALG